MIRGLVKIKVRGQEVDVHAPVLITDEPTALYRTRVWVKKRSDANSVFVLLSHASPTDSITVSSDAESAVMRGNAHSHRPVRVTSMTSFVKLEYGEEE